jgi:F-type H+-transporting ATPase subunit b
MFEVETGLIFWNTVSFAILVALMYKWVLPPVIRALKDRERLIADSVAQAEAGRKKSEELLAAYREKMAAAEASASDLIKQAGVEAEKVKLEIVASAEKQAALALEQAKAEIHSEKKRAMAEARAEIGELVAEAAGRVVGKVIDAHDNRRIIEEALQ